MRRVGWAYGPREGVRIGATRGVYEALDRLSCAACRRAIAPGDRFTRRRGEAVVSPVCRACAPFDDPS
jgi:hypothetical protein